MQKFFAWTADLSIYQINKLQKLQPRFPEFFNVLVQRAGSKVLRDSGFACFVSGDLHKAIGCFKQALAIDREVGDRQGERADLGILGMAYSRLGKLGKAIECYNQRLVIDREIGDLRGQGADLWYIALALDKVGERELAIACDEAALKIYEEFEDPRAEKVRAQLAEWRG